MEKVVIEQYQEKYQPQIIEIFTAGQRINNSSLPANESEAYIAYSISSDLSEIRKVYPNSFWVAILNERVIGCVGLEPKPNKCAELRRMVVHPKYHRLGVGTKLVGCLEAYAKDSGVEKIFLSSLSAAVSALNFYKRLGFVFVNDFTKPKITNEDEVWKLTMLEKNLIGPQCTMEINNQITIETFKDCYLPRIIEMFGAGLKYSMAVPIAELDAIATDLSGIDRVYPDSFWVAKLNDEIIGCVGLELKENNRAELRRMSVDVKYHRLGVGRKLISRLEDFAKQNGVKTIYLDTISTTVSAISFYKRMGWKVIKLFSKPMLSNPTELLPLILLEKEYE